VNKLSLTLFDFSVFALIALGAAFFGFFPGGAAVGLGRFICVIATGIATMALMSRNRTST
jgi:hypothetical protein